MRRTALALLLILGAAGPAAAQVPGIDFAVFPRVGAYRPSGALAELSANRAELSEATAFGVSVELGLPGIPLNLRGTLDYVPGTEGTVNGTALADDNEILLLAADLVWRPLPGVSPIQPYVLLGGGVKKYDFDSGFASALFSFPDEQDLTLHVGGGVAVSLGPIGVMAEITDYISRFELSGTDERKLQNDVFAMVGVKIGLF